MKKLLLFAGFLLPAAAMHAQAVDTILFADFETDPSSFLQTALPPGQGWDNNWYNVDLDGLPDGSPNNRPGEWFWTAPWAAADSTSGNTGVLGSNSWTNQGNTEVQNLLILPAIYIADTNATLSWSSAPYQTPRYLDGYQILVSTTNNDPSSFTDTLFVAAEYASLDNSNAPNDWNSYTFSPAPTVDPLDPFVHGKDWAYIEDNAGDSSRWLGVLRPFSISLAQYANQKIYIEFVHGTYDDNLLEIDNILVMGVGSLGMPQHTQDEMSLKAYPNPTNGVLNLSFTLVSATNVTFNVYDVNGQLVKTDNRGNFAEGVQTSQLDLSDLAAGVYRLEMVTESGRVNSKIVVQ